MTVMTSRIAEEGLRVFSSMLKADFMPSCSAAASRLGADSSAQDWRREVGANTIEGDSGDENAWSELATAGSEGNNRPVGGISSKIGAGDAVWLIAVCSTATNSSGEAEARRGDAKGSGVDRLIIFGEASILPCIARVVTGFGEVKETR